jgi:uncharacterized protein (DUF983 family)
VLHPRRVGRALLRAVRLLCPRCGLAPLFGGWFRMWPACARCGLSFEREQGYYVGALYVNYGVTAVTALAGFLVLDALLGLSPLTQVLLWGGFCVGFPVWFFRLSRSLWLHMDYLIDPW